MPISIPREHLEICDSLANHMNRLAKRFSLKSYGNSLRKYELMLFRKNTNLESKKRQLVEGLHKIVLTTFAVNVARVNTKGKFLSHFRERIRLLRNIVQKLRDINYYIKAIYLKELKITKKARQRNSARGIFTEEEGHLHKKDIDRLEATVYRMMDRIIFLDQKLLNKYKQKEIRLAEKSKLSIMEIETILARQSEMLCHLEAKLPPPSKIKPVLLKKRIYTEWVTRIFALLAAIEHEANKEGVIFSRLKRSNKIKRKLNARISHIVREKFALLRLREKRLFETDGKKRIENEHHIAVHDYAAALRL